MSPQSLLLNSSWSSLKPALLIHKCCQGARAERCPGSLDTKSRNAAFHERATIAIRGVSDAVPAPMAPTVRTALNSTSHALSIAQRSAGVLHLDPTAVGEQCRSAPLRVQSQGLGLYRVTRRRFSTLLPLEYSQFLFRETLMLEIRGPLLRLLRTPPLWTWSNCTSRSCIPFSPSFISLRLSAESRGRSIPQIARSSL